MSYLSKVFERGRQLAVRSLRDTWRANSLANADIMLEKCQSLLSSKGEASGAKLALEVLHIYDQCDLSEKHKFFGCLEKNFGVDQTELLACCAAYGASPSLETLKRLMSVTEPPRQELFRRLNLAPGGTASLVAMRADLIKCLKERPELKDVDNDFLHLFRSWFNTGFLTLEEITWSSPALVLERLIKYEAVHAIQGWSDMKSRLAPHDRRCFAFFHPSLVDEPLIFVEVALCATVPVSIQKILSDDRHYQGETAPKTAAFYSISNCQPGLRGISFGSFLIKQVAQSLKFELPTLETFVTLSPLPGFADWFGQEEVLKRFDVSPEDWDRLSDVKRYDDEAFMESVKDTVLKAGIAYLTESQSESSRLNDSVARFHLGNGARIESLQWQADLSERGKATSLGIMVNYAYDLDKIEANHEAFSINNIVALSPPMKALLKRSYRESPNPSG